jgi:hypothetical protein
MTRIAREIEADIDAWIEQEESLGEDVPDFWHELNASERLAEFLAELGYRKD